MINKDLKKLILDRKAIARKVSEAETPAQISSLLEEEKAAFDEIRAHPEYTPSLENAYGIAYGVVVSDMEDPPNA